MKNLLLKKGESSRFLYNFFPFATNFFAKKYSGLMLGVITRDVPMRTLPTLAATLSSEGFDLNVEGLCRICEPVIFLSAFPENGFYRVLSRNTCGFVPLYAVARISNDCAMQLLNDSHMLYVTKSFILTLPEKNPAFSLVPLSFGSKIPYSLSFGNVTHILLPYRSSGGIARWHTARIKSSGIAFYPLKISRKNIVNLCENMLGIPYDWGERFRGCDCSSLLSCAFFICGAYLPRNTKDMLLLPGENVDCENINKKLSRCRPGDILLCRGHVMIYHHKKGKNHYALHSFSVRGCVAVTSLSVLSSAGRPLRDEIIKIIPLKNIIRAYAPKFPLDIYSKL